MRDSSFAKEFFSVTEFAKIVGTTAETLRHYDRVEVFFPEKTDESSNYRLYSSTQITTIKMINVLTEIGVSLDTIKDLVKQRTPEELMKLLSKQKNILADKLRSLHDTHSVISTFLDLMTEGMCAIEKDLIVSEMPEKHILLGNPNDYSDTVGFFRELIRFCNEQKESALNLSYPIGGYFDTMDDFVRDPSKPMRFFTIDPRGDSKKEEGLYLIGYTRGYYGETNDLPARMAEYARVNSLLFTGLVYNIYLFDEMSILDRSNYLLQVSASVKDMRRAQTRHPVR
jgi:DNA-binding transcriptional MerR regulator